jgi:hypothetical protein
MEGGMSTSEKAFNQVKNILHKLDRSIEQLRQQRSAPPAPVQAVPDPRPASEPVREPSQSRPSNGFGRATPIRQ